MSPGRRRSSVDAVHRAQFELLSRPLGRYEGLAFMFGGVAIVVLATGRFVRTTRLIDDPETHSANDVLVELILSAALMLLGKWNLGKRSL
jgi:putative membrane protein